MIERIEDLKEELAGSAGSDPLEDALRRGAIMSLRAILDIQLIGEE